MKINISRVHYPVHSLGPGKRMIIWLQGCSLAEDGNACYKCISKDLWDKTLGTEQDVEVFGDEIMEVINNQSIDGITISGGEPTDQSEQLEMLHRQLSSSPKLDWLIFTYKTKDQLHEENTYLYDNFDAFVCGKYNYSLSSSTPLLASSNQELVLNTILARNRYKNLEKLPRLEYFFTEGKSVEFAGVPLQDEMETISTKLKDKGIVFESNSWNFNGKEHRKL
jgi:anaerobic ribonucleoside-triphosphate reductase activating protein